ncbi:unnamed protein product [Hermetia illucens]|uniref:Ionotropic glutamate receptor C-terminal domain-containing protein n=1 Tax=Hermetia illucens TaxID=343691 RepID=A0A7R8YQF8_HERIL|nr:unnamed protein product [Hermetia illucens]
MTQGFMIAVFKKNLENEFSIAPHQHNMGVFLNLACPKSDHVLRRAETNNYFSEAYYWIIQGTSFESATERLNRVFIPPCSQVLVIYLNEGSFQLKYFYKAASDTPLRIDNKSHAFHGEIIPNRKDLEGIYLRSIIVIAFPDVFTTLDDQRMRHIDTMAKANFPISRNLREDLNFNFDMQQADNFGWRRPNGSFDGMVGKLQRNEVDFGNVAIFMRLDRIPIVDFAADTIRVRACIMFRQPPLSAVTNIFALPFTGEVWFAILLFLVTTIIALKVLVSYATTPVNMNFMDCVDFAWGAMCQQGFYVDVVSRSGRILVFTTFVTALFLFTSFSANIVALLQSPSETIKSLYELALSPLELGVQDTVYNKIYFKETTDPVTKFLFEKKISPKGDAVFMRPEIGIKRMRKQLFAYQVESQAAYQIISDTYSEPEKCGLKELEPFQLPPMSIPMRKDFPYKELFRQRLRWQREVGLIRREATRWFPPKPRCETEVEKSLLVTEELRECNVKMFYGISVICANNCV